MVSTQPRSKEAGRYPVHLQETTRREVAHGGRHDSKPLEGAAEKAQCEGLRQAVGLGLETLGHVGQRLVRIDRAIDSAPR